MVGRDGVPAGCRLLWSIGVAELAKPPLPPSGPASVRWEVRVTGEWQNACAALQDSQLPAPWGLLLDGMIANQNDDLFEVANLIVVARSRGCGAVHLITPDGEYSYRYRVASLIRYVCDEHKLKFAVVEIQQRPNADGLNRYFASLFCCRGFPKDSLKVPEKTIGLSNRS